MAAFARGRRRSHQILGLQAPFPMTSAPDRKAPHLTVRHDQPDPPDLRVVDPDDTGPPAASRNLEAERAVLGVILIQPGLAEQLRDELDGDDFYLPAHELVWKAIHHVAEHGGTPEPVAVHARLTEAGDAAAAGGAPYLHELTSGMPMPAQAEFYARAVRDAARLRAIDNAGLKLRETARLARVGSLDAALERALETLDQAAARFGPSSESPPAALRDLSFLLDGHWPEIDPPAYGHRADGGALFYRGRVNGLFGDPESAKTWIAKWAMLDAAGDGLCALVDVDHNGPVLTASHLLLLGAKPDWLADHERFQYHEPDDAGELLATVDNLVRAKPAYVALDSVGEILPMLGVKSVDNDEITGALRRIAKPLADAGACVVTIDHLPKSHEARSTGYAIGGTAKKRAVDGAYVHCDTLLTPAPGALGKVGLRIEKDRLGELRRSCGGSKHIGQFWLDSRGDNVTLAKIVRSDAVTSSGEFRPTHLMETVSRVIEDMPLVTGYTIERTVRGKREHVRAALQILLEEAYVTGQPGPRNSTQHTSLKPYREADDQDETDTPDGMF